MTQSELFEMLKQVGIPIAYGTFSKEQTPPYAVYYRQGNTNIFADNKVYHSSHDFVLEVYIVKKNLTLENKIEKLFSDNDIPFDVDEAYLPDEKLRMLIYTFSI